MSAGHACTPLQVFNEFDLDGSGQLDRREMARLVNRLMPDLDSRWAARGGRVWGQRAFFPSVA